MKRFLFILITILSICSMPCMADITEVFNSATGRSWFGITTSDAATSTVKSVTSSETGISYQYVTGIRVKQYDSSDYQTHYSKRVEIPTYDYIRENGWTGVETMGK